MYSTLSTNDTDWYSPQGPLTPADIADALADSFLQGLSTPR